MSQARKSNSQFGKKVKGSPLPSRNRKVAAKVKHNHSLTVEYLLALAAFSGMLLKRIQQLEAGSGINPKARKRPQ